MSRKKTNRYFYSYKAKKHIWIEGISEWDVAFFLEFHKIYTTWESQPATFTLVAPNGQEFGYTPDFIAKQENSKKHLVIEAKTLGHQLSKDDQNLLSYCFSKHHHEHFVHWTKEDLGSEQELDNYKILYPYLKIEPETIISLNKLNQICDGVNTFGELRDVLLENGINDNVAFSLAAHKFIIFDLDTPLTDCSIVRLS